MTENKEQATFFSVAAPFSPFVENEGTVPLLEEKVACPLFLLFYPYNPGECGLN